MKQPQRIRVLIGKVGLDGHDRGAKVIAQALRDAGMEVIYTGLRQSPEQIVAAAVQEDVQVIGISILSGAHGYLLPKIADLLRQEGAGDILLLAGGVIPSEDKTLLKEAGVAEVFSPGTPTAAIVNFIQRALTQYADSYNFAESGIGTDVVGEILNLDHIGIAVKDLPNAVKLFESLGLHATHRETVEAQRVHTVTLPIGNTKLELLESTTEDSAVAKFLKSRGEGVHHLALQVNRLEDNLRRLKSLGLRLIDETPRIGIGGTKVAFIHPQSTLGTLIELVERQSTEEAKPMESQA